MFAFGLMKCNFVGSKNRSMEKPRVNISAVKYCEICCFSPFQKYRFRFNPENILTYEKFKKRG